MSMVITAVAYVANKVFIEPQQDALDEQKRANRRAEQTAKEQADLADQANNKANQKRPNFAAFAAANKANNNGIGSTMLTGAQGVTGSVPLAKTTLLGG